uniref:Hemerythrin n=1 Tax=Pectinaria gouldii TaxID=260746 RepID=A0A1S6QCT7_PECGU|nr:hemerythrin [Pectinaria gouldii]
MGFDIPEPFVWDESFKVFIETLDEEHKGLFAGIFDVAANPGCGKSLDSVQGLVSKHFADEEGLMEAAKYPDLESHRKLHVEFVEKLNKVATPVSGDTIVFAKDWLVNHIKGIDHKYINKL